jgi:hypothetical protein
VGRKSWDARNGTIKPMRREGMTDVTISMARGVA